MKKVYLFLSFCFFSFSLTAQNVQWTWVSGDNTANKPGIYGIKGIADVKNKPGARGSAVSWTDASGNLWLFGGTTKSPLFNDLWKYNPGKDQWIWVSGDNKTDQRGIYGSKGKAAPGNKPGARHSAISWVDNNNDLWLFGGEGFGFDSTKKGLLNDLWKYNSLKNEWTWISGDNNINRQGEYGVKGTAFSRNSPGAREGSVSWIDASGNLWLFGGLGFADKEYGYLNDLWIYNQNDKLWTWVSGDKYVNQNGMYGTRGKPASQNQPGSRSNSVSWEDDSGSLWLFGGFGFDEKNAGCLNDLWQYNISKNVWTWVSGDNGINKQGIYGTKGVAHSNNKPGGRRSPVSWADPTGNLWLFGGYSLIGNYDDRFNDLWKYDLNQHLWTWVSGDNKPDEYGIYGTRGKTAPDNKPGARYLSVSWAGRPGSFYVFGGSGYEAFREEGFLNDLWEFNQFSLSCPASVKVLADSKNCSSIVKDIDPVIIPKDLKVNFTLSGATQKSGSGTASGLVFNLGVTTVNYRLADDDRQSCMFTVTVEDDGIPVPSVDPLLAKTGECSVTVTSRPTATYKCRDTIITGSTRDPLTYNVPGNYTITWVYLTNNGDTLTQQQRVIVKSGQGLTPTVNPLPDLTGECSVTVSAKPTAKDNCSVIITGTTTNPLTYDKPGTFIITWLYRNNNGDTLTQQQRVIVKSGQGLTPTVNPLPDVTGECSVTVSAKPTAKDNCSVIITGTTTNPLTYDKPGTYIITWLYKNNNGDTLTQQQRVIVKSGQGITPTVNPLPDVTGECSVTVTGKPTAKDNCSVIITGTTTNPLTYDKPGTYTITWLYKNNNGDTLTQQQRVIVKSGQGLTPTVNPLPDVTGECSVTVTTKPTAKDNCSEIVTATTTDPLTYNAPGTYTITWLYKNYNGDTLTQKQRVLVKDDTAPIPTQAFLLDINGACSLEVVYKPTATDNCSGIITGTTTDPLTYTGKGTYKITWKYTDRNGNTSTQVQRVIMKNLDFKVAAFPNPTNNLFTLIVTSCNLNEKVNIRIYDVLGRVLDVMSVIPNQAVQIGATYAAAAYFAQITQGKEIVTVKLLKMK